ncbi:hypothetical protein [uncultured Shewanella sp.]|uniref:hypothetical protein n=1 Tax=uncultured Shewanella sp. TaxID=173975 RepID=UPI002629FCD5|nr:hypothetical protein [uncultured Shewanella sp.]
MLFSINILPNTQSIYYLVGISITIGTTLSLILYRTKSLLFYYIPKNEKWAAKSLSFVGTIAFTTALLGFINITYAKNESLHTYKIVDKKYHKGDTKSPKSWQFVVQRKDEFINIKVSNDEYNKYHIADDYIVREIQGLFNWTVLLSK